ncbi:hypothetical protein LZC95_38295 [Pendulispora brunnea]|uniref:Imm33-like domain-containing protein n=1 Tax=Pendulispora brunnea TaxID=2905690 RepID=A0ABZ2K0M1_9BACT
MLCRKYGSPWVASPDHMKVGIAKNVLDGLLPINGLRHPIEGATSGWFIWAGQELSSAPDFFAPLHIGHLAKWCPPAPRFLGLAPGWRFLMANGYEDVWEDAALLDVCIPNVR